LLVLIAYVSQNFLLVETACTNTKFDVNPFGACRDSHDDTVRADVDECGRALHRLDADVVRQLRGW